jgi:hypothetical protein
MPKDEIPVSDAGQRSLEPDVVPKPEERTSEGEQTSNSEFKIGEWVEMREQHYYKGRIGRIVKPNPVPDVIKPNFIVDFGDGNTQCVGIEYMKLLDVSQVQLKLKQANVILNKLMVIARDDIPIGVETNNETNQQNDLKIQQLEAEIYNLHQKINRILEYINDDMLHQCAQEHVLTEHTNLLSNITQKADIYGQRDLKFLEPTLAEVGKILLWLEMNSPRKENSQYYEAMNPMLVNFFMNLFTKYTGRPFEEILSEITDKDVKKIVNKMIKNREKEDD